VERGLLVPVKGFAYDAPDLRNLHRTGGDYNERELANLIDVPRTRGNVVEQYLLRARGTRALVFAVNVDHSRKLCEEFRLRGIAAEHVDGDTARADRAAIFDRFRTGQTMVLTNCQLFTEGVDLPAIETVILARPTASLALALQMIGRGRRPLPCSCGAIPHWRNATCACGAPVRKRYVRLHDHAGATFDHGMPDEPRVWSLTDGFQMDTQAKSIKPKSALRTCRKCFAIYMADEPACPQCGERNIRLARIVRTSKGVAVSLDDVERAAKAQSADPPDASVQKKFFFFLLTVEYGKRYRRGYAEMRFHGRFKCWPPATLWRAEFKAKGSKAQTGQHDFVPASQARQGAAK
jgi:superfamily II DNA or RNA helicase